MSYSSSRADHTVDMLLPIMRLFHLIYLPDELVAWHGIFMTLLAYHYDSIRIMRMMMIFK